MKKPRTRASKRENPRHETRPLAEKELRATAGGDDYSGFYDDMQNGNG